MCIHSAENARPIWEHLILLCIHMRRCHTSCNLIWANDSQGHVHFWAFHTSGSISTHVRTVTNWHNCSLASRRSVLCTRKCWHSVCVVLNVGSLVEEHGHDSETVSLQKNASIPSMTEILRVDGSWSVWIQRCEHEWESSQGRR